MTDFAPSEEFTLHCDVPGCTAGVSMVSEVARAEHGWGRISLYAAVGGDMDLCPRHLKAVWAVLKGEKVPYDFSAYEPPGIHGPRSSGQMP